MKILHVAPLTGCEPEIGRWLWALQEARGKTLALVQDMDQATLDWEGPDGGENAIGSILYHVALAEMEWLFLNLMQQNVPESIHEGFPHPAEDAEGRLSRVIGVPLEEHLDRLHSSRELLLAATQPMSIKEWRRSRRPLDRRDREVSPEWVVFHLLEHEAGHGFQISAIKARAKRALAVERR
jgi:DinB superfamily